MVPAWPDSGDQGDGEGLGPGPDGRDDLPQTGPRDPSDLPDADIPGPYGREKGFRAREFAALLTDTYRRLGAPLIVVWDNASTHHAKALREFCDRNSDWLTIVKLPPYAPDLNPVEGVWAHVKKSLANLAPRAIEDLTPLVKNRLRGIQRRPEVLDGFIAETGLALEPP
ncbi:transposase [Streptomyces sp. NPDC048584]|uniref:transposase n=1 Tax=Streptomyces sp. NPDC048584 TaxID=3365573 RepID=UPI003718FF8C